MNAIKSFEAAARHCSMTKAAQELGVSQVAVTRAVQLLESWAGSPVFIRSNRQISLTPVGEEYYRVVNLMLNELSAATNRLIRSPELHLRIWSVSLINWWLFPRIRAFMMDNPDIKIELTSNERLENLPSSDFDIVIREGPNEQATSDEVIRLMPIELTPVCRPGPDFHDLVTYADLRKHTLLHSAYRPDAWRGWLDHVGCDSVDPGAGLVLDNSGYCFHAAADGLGLALGQLALIGGEIEKGRLARPFSDVLTTETSYYMIINPTRRRKSLSKFARWIMESATNT